MKKTFIFFFTFLMCSVSFSQSVGVGTTTPNASAALDVQSTNKGLLPPRMTTIQRDAISSPTPGLMLFNTDTQCLEVFTNAGWFAIKKTNFAIEKLLGGASNDENPDIQKTKDGGYIIAGYSTSSATGDVTGINHGPQATYDFWIVKLNANGNITWNKLLGGNGSDSNPKIQQTTDGGYIVAGLSNSSANGDVTGINHGGTDYWIVKLDANGNITWNKLLGGDGGDGAYSILQTTDGGYIVAGSSGSSANGDVTGANHGVGFSPDYWIVKLDANGNITWNKLLGGFSYEEAYSIQQTIDGGYIVAGISSSSANGDVTGANHGTGLSADYWIVKLDANGNITWNKLLGGTASELDPKILHSTDGGYIVAGISSSSATGDVTGINHGGYDYWIVKLDANGNIIWNKLLGGSSGEGAGSIQQTTDGGYIVAGSSNSSATGDVSGINHGNSDYWIVKLDALGNIVWNKLLGGSNNENAYSIQQTTNGGYIVAGTSWSFANGDVTRANHGANDFWIIRLDAFGNIINQ